MVLNSFLNIPTRNLCSYIAPPPSAFPPALKLVAPEILKDYNYKDSLDISIKKLYNKAKKIQNKMPSTIYVDYTNKWSIPLDKQHDYDKKIRVKYEIEKAIKDAENISKK